ncbi:hypothetical protein [Actinokineospora sp.]|uniref:hypothetical protein n=1 Tax=Actinokineospora sp. TaxID=1872133 RepID=UPI003D6B2F4A
MRRSEWEWQQSEGTLHAALVGGARYRFCPGDEVRCVCGVDLVLTVEDFPRRPQGTRTCTECTRLLVAAR